MIWTDERKALARASCQKWQDTPHRPRLAVVGVGIDCIQFLAEVISDSGIIPKSEFTGYVLEDGMFRSSRRLRDAISSCLDVEEINPKENQFGDIAIFVNGNEAQHCGFLDDAHVWHSLATRGVIRSKYSGVWRAGAQVLLRIKSEGFRVPPQSVV